MDAEQSGRRGPPSPSQPGPRSPIVAARLWRRAPHATSPRRGCPRRGPGRLRPRAAASRGVPRHWGPVAPALRRSPAPGPRASRRPRPAAPPRLAGVAMPAAPALAAAARGARRRRPTAPRAVGRCSRQPPATPQGRGADSARSSPFAPPARSGGARRWRRRPRRRWRFTAGSRLPSWLRSLAPVGGGGGRAAPSAPVPCPGLRPARAHAGDERQHAGQAHPRSRGSGLDRGLLRGYSPPATGGDRGAACAHLDGWHTDGSGAPG